MMTCDDHVLWQKLARTVTPKIRQSQPKVEQPKVEQPKVETTSRLDLAVISKTRPSIKTTGTERDFPASTAKTCHRQNPADLNSHNYGGISRRDAMQIKSGRMTIEGRLDLHGLTLAQAQQSLGRFILGAAAQHKRTVLVVTGKGKNNTGVIRQHLPQWLNDGAVKHHIIAFSTAQPKDGGSGAFYLRLRTPVSRTQPAVEALSASKPVQ